MIVRHTFKPLNNARLGHLCGPLDEHLRRIEEALGVTIAHRHEQFKVDGPKAIADQAVEVLQALYEIADRPIDAAVVQLTLASDSGMGADGEDPSLPTTSAGGMTALGGRPRGRSPSGPPARKLSRHA